MAKEKPADELAAKTASRLDPAEGEEGLEEGRMRAKWELLQGLKGRKIIDAQAGFWMSKNTGEEVMLLLDDNTVLYLSTVQLDEDGEPVDEASEKGVYMGLEAMREAKELVWDPEPVKVDENGEVVEETGRGAHGCGCDDEDCDCDCDDDCDCEDDCGCGDECDDDCECDEHGGHGHDDHGHGGHRH